jgi:hypothetical protein
METLQNHFIFQIFICYFAFWRSFASKKKEKEKAGLAQTLQSSVLKKINSFAGYI